MADFFEELGKRISDVASDLGKKTEDPEDQRRYPLFEACE